MTNRARIERLVPVIELYENVHGADDPQTLIQDLLADLMHWVDIKLPDVDFDDLNETAQMHFAAEVEEAYEKAVGKRKE